MSSVAHELRAYLVAAGLCTDAEITVSRMPANGQVDIGDGQWVLLQAPGSKSGGNILQWKRTHSITILYRHKSGDELYNKDDDLQKLFEACVDLPSYKITRATCPPGGELPLDAKEVHVMQWAATLELVTKENEES